VLVGYEEQIASFLGVSIVLLAPIFCVLGMKSGIMKVTWA
jgi:hypothetical protein